MLLAGEERTGGDSVGVACAQLAPALGDLDGNRRRARRSIAEAAAAGARVVVLPELCVTGYAFASRAEAEALAETSEGPTTQDWHAQAARHDLVVVGGLCELGPGGELFNSVAVVDRDGIRAVYRKTHLWDREQLVFTPGDERPPVVDTAAGRIGVAICYDAFFPELMRGLALDGAELIALPTNSPLLEPRAQPLPMEVVVAMATAHVNRVFVAMADRAGPERGIEWAEASAIVDPSGVLLAGPRPGAALLAAGCELARARDKRWNERNDVLGDRRPELYGPASVAAAR